MLIEGSLLESFSIFNCVGLESCGEDWAFALEHPQSLEKVGEREEIASVNLERRGLERYTLTDAEKQVLDTLRSQKMIERCVFNKSLSSIVS